MFKKAPLRTLTLITATCDGLNFKFGTSNQRRVYIYLYIFGGTSIRQTRRRITGSTAEVSVSIKEVKTIPEKRIETKHPPVRDKGAPEWKR